LNKLKQQEKMKELSEIDKNKYKIEDDGDRQQMHQVSYIMAYLLKLEIEFI